MADEKVTVRFESQINNPDQNDPLLISGPVEIFADTEKFEDLGTNETRNAVKDYIEEYNTNIGIEDSDEYVIPSIIVFVSNVTELNMNDPNHRGAYFRYSGTYEDLINTEKPLTDLWREVLLGTHSHKNIRTLESLGEIDAAALKEGTILTMNPDGLVKPAGFTIDDLKNSKLPELPDDVKAKLAEYEKYKDLMEPEIDEVNHLDAPLESLTNTYDWLGYINGETEAFPIGSCRELYEALIKANKRLFITSNFKLSTDGGVCYVNLGIEKFNYKLDETFKDAIDAHVYSKNTNFYELEFPCKFNVDSSYEIFLFDENDILTDIDYKILSIKDNKIKILISRKSIDKKIQEDGKQQRSLTVLVARKYYTEVKDNKISDIILSNDETFRIDFINAIQKGVLSLADINLKLAELYVDGEFGRRPVIPRLYLCTDEKGNPKWDNTLLPAQNFYADSVVVDKTYLANPDNIKGNFVKIEFPTKYDPANDFPILMVNELFEFEIKPSADSKETTIYYLPISSDEKHYDFNLDTNNENVKVTLVMMRKPLGGDLADELAKKYVTKEDAISILSHGKLELSSYAKKSDLDAYSKIGHTHSQYALKEHNHDYHYANFYHTHPEILAYIASVLNNGASEEEIKKWLDELDSKYQTLIGALFESAGFKKDEENGSYSLYDESVKASNDLIEAINKKIDDDSFEMDKLIPGQATIKDVLQYITIFFEHDTVLDSQVKLEHKIPVVLKNGPIGGIDSNRTYEKGESLQKILQDILNPYLTVSDVRKILTPANIILHWFISDPSNNGYEEVDPMHLRYSEVEIPLYFKAEPVNYKNEKCEYKVDSNGNEILLKTIISPDESYELNKDGYYIYDYAFKFKDDELLIKDIKFTWKSNLEDDTIYDNYGTNAGTLNEKDNPGSLTITPEFSVDYTDYYFGVVNDIDNFEISDLKSYIGNESAKIEFNSRDNKFIVLLYEASLEEKIHVYDDETNHEITFIMDEMENPKVIDEINYYCKYYEIMNDDAALRIRVNIK